MDDACLQNFKVELFLQMIHDDNNWLNNGWFDTGCRPNVWRCDNADLSWRGGGELAATTERQCRR